MAFHFKLKWNDLYYRFDTVKILLKTLVAGLFLSTTAHAEPAAPGPEMVDITTSCHALQLVQAERYMILARLISATQPSTDEAKAQVDQFTQVAFVTAQTLIKQGAVYDLYATSVLKQGDAYHEAVITAARQQAQKLVMAIAIQPDKDFLTGLDRKSEACNKVFNEQIAPALAPAQ